MLTSFHKNKIATLILRGEKKQGLWSLGIMDREVGASDSILGCDPENEMLANSHKGTSEVENMDFACKKKHGLWSLGPISFVWAAVAAR